MEALEHIVAEGTPPERLDRFAVEVFGLPSRARARKLLRAGRLTLNGETPESCRRVKAGDRLALSAPPTPPPVYARDMAVVYLDEHMAVVEKPPGIPVSGNKHRTLEHALPHNLPPCEHPEALYVPRPVHRLDVRTGGLVVVARTAPAQVGLGRLFQERAVKKRYRALVVGRLEGEGEETAPVEGREARSRWRAVDHTRSLHVGWLTTVDLWPVTGRTHQLRLHMAWRGHPVLGDDQHGGERAMRGKGLFLRALALDLPHPITGAPLSVSIGEPEKFASFRRREQDRWDRYQERQAGE